MPVPKDTTTPAELRAGVTVCAQPPPEARHGPAREIKRLAGLVK
jgi:hypothetical protein